MVFVSAYGQLLLAVSLLYYAVFILAIKCKSKRPLTRIVDAMGFAFLGSKRSISLLGCEKKERIFFPKKVFFLARARVERENNIVIVDIFYEHF